MALIEQLVDFDHLLMRRLDASIKEQEELREMHKLVQVLIAIFTDSIPENKIVADAISVEEKKPTLLM
ncbi:MAG: hypothetical protein ACR2OW_03610 [Methyloligellaceae bacterium]